MDNVKFINSLRFKLIAITIVLILFPIILFSIVYSSLVKDIISKKYSESAIQSVYEAGENIDFILNDIREFSNALLANRDMISALNDKNNMDVVAFRSLLRSFFTSREDIDAIYVYAGRRVYSVGVNKVAEMEDYMPISKLAETDGEIVWINTRREKIKILAGEFDKYYFSLGRKLIDFNTLEELGLLTVDIDEMILESSYKSLISGDIEQIFIANKYGEIVSHPDKSKIGQSIENEVYAKEILAAEKKSGYISFKDQGVKKIAIYSTCDVNDWKLVKIIPYWYLYREIDEIQWKLIRIGVLYVMITSFFMLLFSLKITEPIINMMKLMKKAENGDLGVQIDTKGQDEIGQLGMSFNTMINKMRSLINKLIEEERHKKELEFEVLHAQINPHFLYNTLNTIRWMAKIQGAKSASSALTALIKLLMISINFGKDMISLEEEIEYVKNYILIQRLRFNERFTIDYNLEEACLSCHIPKLILQPIVENSIIYGLQEEDAKPLNIEIKAYNRQDMLIVEVSDNGPGIKPEILKNILKSEKDANKFSTVGLNNINQRIKLAFGESYGIKIFTKENHGTNIVVELPCKGEVLCKIEA
ncbi:sensor histidine kinase [Clostridium formicaceticum]|uniref:Sensor-like histidine kinase n=1 Tax=Clostridium formicaceticum TaxID=1497 RepID=A0AAC9RNR4_9CLOT|nr:sensor histidine kinase [Clostridium formicaceticum]AOY77681.1 hypothetical protein BJL90_18545 [Clostridium formicaceticum]ARE88268.1 putative sensor-like histidine kinase [Clostridium formicaceticum]